MDLDSLSTLAQSTASTLQQEAGFVGVTVYGPRLPRTCSTARPCALGSKFNSERARLTTQQWKDEFPPVKEAEIVKVYSKLYNPIFSWQTRIIELEDAPHFDDPLVCRLLVADLIAGQGVGIAALGRVLDYTAISYSWGHSTFTCAITCNNTSFPITRHLSEALRHFRRQHTRFFWIDVFCINQNDLIEKGRQVENMLLIFQKASSVCAWLGLSNPGEKLALDACAALDQLMPSKQIDEHPLSDRFKDLDVSFKTKIVGKAVMNAGVCHDHLIQCQVDMAAIVTKYQWFRRTWVRQEVFAARDMVLHTDTWSMAWTQFQQIQYSLVTVMDSMFDWHAGPLDAIILLRQLRQLEEHRNAAVSKGDGRGYLDLMMNASKSECTRPCDKIYGVIGIIEGCKATYHAPNTQEMMFPIDYTLSDAQIYAAFVKHTIKRTRSFDILCVFEGPNTASSIIDLPSWVPDFNAQRSRAFCTLHAPKREYGHIGSVFGDQSVNQVAEDVCEWNELPVVAFVIGEVTEIVQPTPAHRSSPYYFEDGNLCGRFTIRSPNAGPRRTYRLRELKHFLLQDFGYVIAILNSPIPENALAQRSGETKIGAVAPMNTRVGDLVALPDAARFPHVMRPCTQLSQTEFERPRRAHHSYIGLCLMGEVIVEESGCTSVFPVPKLEALWTPRSSRRYQMAPKTIDIENVARKESRLFFLR